MTRRTLTTAGSVILGLAGIVHIASARAQAPKQKPAALETKAAEAVVSGQSAGMMPLESQTALVKQYCSGCHNDTVKSGGMTLTQLDLAHLDRNPELAEKVIRKLRTGLMPPSTVTKRPDVQTVNAFVMSLETQMDKLAALHPNPGSRPWSSVLAARASSGPKWSRSSRDEWP